jgi:hypothetical protein
MRRGDWSTSGCEDPRRYRFLDAAQLVKHYLGLKCRFGRADVALAYVYWEPSDADGVAECLVHRAEVAAFAKAVGDPRMRFVARSYPDLWSEWDAPGRPGWLRAHVAALRARYDVALGG